MDKKILRLICSYSEKIKRALYPYEHVRMLSGICYFAYYENVFGKK